MNIKNTSEIKQISKLIDLFILNSGTFDDYGVHDFLVPDLEGHYWYGIKYSIDASKLLSVDLFEFLEGEFGVEEELANILIYIFINSLIERGIRILPELEIKSHKGKSVSERYFKGLFKYQDRRMSLKNN